jgi:DNA-binding transcriptional MerR regulator
LKVYKPVMTATGVRIGELAKLTKASASALRYYESAGLLQPPTRTENGYRSYPIGAAGRVEFIRRAQALGMSIAEIRQLVTPATSDPAALRHSVAHRLAAVKQRQADLESLSRELEQLYVRLARHPAEECGHVGDCGCWLPTEEEVMTMTQEVQGLAQCDCRDCPDPSCADCSSCCAGG